MTPSLVHYVGANAGLQLREVMYPQGIQCLALLQWICTILHTAMPPVGFLDNRDNCSLQRVTRDCTCSVHYTYTRGYREAEGRSTVL